MNLPKGTEVTITLPDGKIVRGMTVDIGTFGDEDEYCYGLIKWEENEDE